VLGCLRKLTFVEALFDHKRQIQESDVTLSASYMEIYRDEVYDLFVDRETVGLVFAYSGWYRLQESLLTTIHSLPIGP
jgi:hypothetical protein